MDRIQKNIIKGRRAKERASERSLQEALNKERRASVVVEWLAGWLLGLVVNKVRGWRFTKLDFVLLIDLRSQLFKQPLARPARGAGAVLSR